MPFISHLKVVLHSAQVALAGVFCAAPDGNHLLISASGETVRFTLADDALVRSWLTTLQSSIHHCACMFVLASSHYCC